MDITWLVSERGTLVPFIDGYKFVLNKSGRAGIVYWKCSNPDCVVTGSTVDFILKRLKNAHNHPLSNIDWVLGQFRHKLRSKISEEPFKSAKWHFDDALLFFLEKYATGSEELSFLPGFDSCKTFIYNEKHYHYPASNGSEFNFIFDLRFSLTRSRNRFLQIDENVFGRLLIFSDIEFSSKFFRDGTDTHLSMDGTFKSSPSNFYQLYIIYAKLHGQFFPLFFAFLENKTTNLYVRLLLHVKELLFTQNIIISPTSIMIDFEIAMYNAIKIVFPDSLIRGCFFHFGQAIWRKLCFLGLKRIYNVDRNFSKIVGYISALPLVPLSEVNHTWIFIKSLYPTRDVEIEEFFNYIETTWLNNTNPLFDREVWSHFSNYNERTNNASEGFNSRLSRKLNKAHPNIYEALDTITQIQAVNDVEVNGLILGNSPRRQKRKYRKAHVYIINTRTRFLAGEIGLVDLIKAMSRAIKLCLNE